MKKIFLLLSVFVCFICTAFQVVDNNNPLVATLGDAIRGNHLENGVVVKPVVTIADIMRNNEIKINGAGWRVAEYKYSIMSAQKQFWGSFVVTGGKLDERLLAQLKDPAFKKGRLFIENIRLVHSSGRKAIANNIIIDYDN